MKKYILKHINRVLFSDFLKTVSIFLIATLLALLLVNVSAIKDNVDRKSVV